MKRIALSDHFDLGRLVRFVLPSVVMMVFTSIYSVVDGLFVSNFAGATAFAAVNLIMPLLMGMGTVGFLIGTGGSAVVAKTLGEGKHELACRYFSMLIYVTVALGALLTAVGLAVLRPVAAWLGAEGQMLEECVRYGSILMAFQTAFMLQCAFQSFFVAAEKPRLGLWVTVAAGMSNILLDALMVGVLGWGAVGAAVATVISQLVGGVWPICYFARKNDSLLRLTKAGVEWRILWKTCTNGSSELMTNLSGSLVNALYNFQLMHLAGQNGVAAYGAIMYVNFTFSAIFFGYAIGSAPVISFHYGAGNAPELRSLLGKSLWMMVATGAGMFALSQLLAAPLAKLFVGYDAELFALTSHGFRVYAVSFLFAGISIFASAFFTALGNGAVSAAISFLRALAFQVPAILLLPRRFGIDGIWSAIVVAELLAVCVSAALIAAGRRHYGYGRATQAPAP